MQMDTDKDRLIREMKSVSFGEKLKLFCLGSLSGSWLLEHSFILAQAGAVARAGSYRGSLHKEINVVIQG